MSEMVPSRGGEPATVAGAGGLGGGAGGAGATNLADVLERVLDKGIVIVGDIRVNLLDIELLTIKLRLVVAGVDTARRIGIDWWEHDPWLSGADEGGERGELDARLRRIERRLDAGPDAGADRDARPLEQENEALREQVERLQRQLSRGGEAGDG